MTSANRRNFIAVALPVFLLMVLLAVMRFVSAGIRLPQTAQANGAQNALQRPMPADGETRKAIAARITGQVDAFQKKDYRRALSFSARGFRESITPERFQELMQQRYAALTNATEVKIGRLLVRGEAAQAEVYVTGSKEGAASAFGYTLEKEGNDWNVVTVAPLLLPSRPVPALTPQPENSSDR